MLMASTPPSKDIDWQIGLKRKKPNNLLFTRNPPLQTETLA
jgi:hypothetical protein